MIATLADLPRHIATQYPRQVFLRRCHAGGFDDYSTADVVAAIRELALGLETLGLRHGDRVAIMSESRPEWVFADLAVLSLGAITVPIYPTLTASQAGYILADCGARLAIVSDDRQASKVQEVRHLAPELELVIVIEPSGAPTPSNAGSIVTFAEIRRRGRERLAREPELAGALDERAAAISPDDLATIIYTSGTTGEPKGVMLTHGNIVANIIGVQPVHPKGPDDVALSFLPLSHAFERLVVYVYFTDGVTTVFAENIDTLARDLPATAPTLLTAVPRVFEKLRARILETVEQGSVVRRRLFHWALQLGLARVARAQAGQGGYEPVGWREKLADRLVFAKVRARVGGRLRLLVSGSAPLPREIAEFFAAAGLLILEGYGLTETAPVLTVNLPGKPRFGTVGPPIPNVQLRIAEDGEILARGPNVMRGYWNKPEATAEALVDGWFHTGDIGELSADGYLTITDRKKDLLVTSGGKKVPRQPIESQLKANPLVGEAVVVGDGRKYPSVLIMPNFAVLEHRLAVLGREGGSREELVRRPDVIALYQEIVDAMNKGLAQYEQIKRIALLLTEFSIEGGELTPTLKVKRQVVEARWKDVIDSLYA
ncbi:MAG TPA: long-chain fatty acid--CoA ligase [Vicinamibacterales bacterium]